MNVNIVGAGPAGTYFAIALKQRVPSAKITLLEKGSQDKQNGLGYVLQQRNLQELFRIDNKVVEHLKSETTDVWNHVEIEAKGHTMPVEFPPSIGIRRSKLMTYLRSLAEDSGVEIKYDVRLSVKDIDALKVSSDLLVGADGINSIVRERYVDEIGLNTIVGSNSFAWLSANTNKAITRVVLTEGDGMFVKNEEMMRVLFHGVNV